MSSVNDNIKALMRAMEEDPKFFETSCLITGLAPELIKLWIAAEDYVGEGASVKDFDVKFDGLVEALVNLNTRSHQVIP